CLFICFFFSSRRRHTRSKRDWSSDVCSSDLEKLRRDACRGRESFRKNYCRISRAVGLRGSSASGGRWTSAHASAERQGRRLARQIGRASCRERRWRSGVGGGVERKRRRQRSG